MKTILLLLFFISQFAMADIPLGKYQLEKIQCTTGKVLKLGGTFMEYKVFLLVKEHEMIMTANAKSKAFADFILNCKQTNRGKYSYVGETQYEGYLQLEDVKCNNGLWTNIIKKRNFGVEEQGVSNYSINGNKLKISTPKTTNLYSCKDDGGRPEYYYKKVN